MYIPTLPYTSKNHVNPGYPQIVILYDYNLILSATKNGTAMINNYLFPLISAMVLEVLANLMRFVL
jgi:hypothetical protein